MSPPSHWVGQEKTFFEGEKNLPKYGNPKLHTSRAHQKRYRIRETYDLRLTGTAVSPLGAKAGEMLAISSHIKGKTKQYKAKKKRTTDGDKSSSRPTKEGKNPSFELDALQILCFGRAPSPSADLQKMCLHVSTP